MQQVGIKVGRKYDGKFYFSAFKGCIYLRRIHERFFYTEKFAPFHFTNDLLRSKVFSIVHHRDICILDLVRQRKSEENNLYDRQSKEHKQGLPIPENLVKLFFYE